MKVRLCSVAAYRTWKINLLPAFALSFFNKLGRTETIATERKIVLVISPLVSLMVDQVSNVQVHGIGAAILSGNAGINEVLLASEWGVSQGKYRLMFTAPEAITGNSRWKQVLTELFHCQQIVAVAIDEAYCVYKW